MSQLKLAVFDVDGTLVDSQHHINGAMQRTFGALDLECPPIAQIRRIIGLSLPVAMRQLLPDLSDAQYVALVEGYKNSFKTSREAGASALLYPGIHDLLDGLAQDQDLLLGLATGKSRRGLDAMLTAHGLAQHFVTAQVADNHPSKPHPAMLLAAMSETGADPADSVMIGDTTFDMQMGQAAGMGCIGVSWGYHPVDELRQAGAAHIVDDAAELLALLAGYWGK